MSMKSTVYPCVTPGLPARGDSGKGEAGKDGDAPRTEAGSAHLHLRVILSRLTVRTKQNKKPKV